MHMLPHLNLRSIPILLNRYVRLDVLRHDRCAVSLFNHSLASHQITYLLSKDATTVLYSIQPQASGLLLAAWPGCSPDIHSRELFGFCAATFFPLTICFIGLWTQPETSLFRPNALSRYSSERPRARDSVPATQNVEESRDSIPALTGISAPVYPSH